MLVYFNQYSFPSFIIYSLFLTELIQFSCTFTGTSSIATITFIRRDSGSSSYFSHTFLTVGAIWRREVIGSSTEYGLVLVVYMVVGAVHWIHLTLRYIIPLPGVIVHIFYTNKKKKDDTISWIFEIFSLFFINM